MAKAKIKTIDIQAKEWLDKVNGNSYFSAQITINFGMKSEQTFKLPFQYGYGDQYKSESCNFLIEKGILKSNDSNILWRICKENKIILRHSIQSGCLKKDVVNWGK